MVVALLRSMFLGGGVSCRETPRPHGNEEPGQQISVDRHIARSRCPITWRTSSPQS